ncbi:hypothetical protein PENSPDRAFT_665250 [Peniophora sp. CONT]|nr:hypothetical protein PENSPDRAFT_665250 [Peniophora sp. CONT]
MAANTLHSSCWLSTPCLASYAHLAAFLLLLSDLATSDEVLQLILNEIAKPSAFVVLNRKLRAFASDAYVRARYFLARHGKAQALFYALGRGDIVTERVIELAVQHYHHGHVSFISRPWVRNLPFIVFARFLSLASARFDGEFKLPTKKDPDDGTKFQRWIDERKRKIGSDKEKEARGVVEELIERWRFQPVCDKDPALAHFALTLAVEPKILALAVANGYSVDPVAARYSRLMALSLFLSRTVAAEICLEAKANKVAYDVLKALDRDGLLRFDLITLIQDLIKSFVTKRSITDSSTAAAIHHLFNDLPAHAANDAGVRHVVLLTIFSTSLTAHIANARLLKLGLAPDPVDAVPGVRQVYRVYNTADTLAPISRAELVAVLLSPYVRTHHAIATYARFYAFYPNKTVEGMLEEVALACLKLPGKGEMLEMLTRRYTGLRRILGQAIKTYKFELDDLPAHDASDGVKRRFRVALGRRMDDESVTMSDSYLGDLTHETLSESFARDVVEERKPSGWQPYRGARALRGPQLERKKDVDAKTKDVETTTKDGTPNEMPLSTARWVIDTFGSLSAQAAVFADHVVANWLDEKQTSRWRSSGDGAKDEGTLDGVPMTMKHWEILARLGRQPLMGVQSERMLARVAAGETFYERAEDYISASATPGSVLAAKSEADAEVGERLVAEVLASLVRPRRAAAEKVKSYIELESDDDEDGSDVGDGSANSSDAVIPIVKVEQSSTYGNVKVKAEPVEPAMAVKTEVAPVADDGEDCDCTRNCHARCWCGCHSDMDSDDEFSSEDEGVPIERCKLGLDCPERHAFFGAPGERRTAEEKARLMRVEVERERCAAAADKGERDRKEAHEKEMQVLSKRIEKAVENTGKARHARDDWVWRRDDTLLSSGGVPKEGVSRMLDSIGRMILKRDEDIERAVDEEKRLKEESKALDTDAAEKLKQLSLWTSGLGALHKGELQKHANMKKRLGLKRASKSAFVITLDANLWRWRDSLRETKER